MPFVFFPMIVWIVILVGGFKLATRLIEAIERRGGRPDDEVVALREQLARMEEAMESLGSRLERLDEAQRFTTRLLEDRPERDTGDDVRVEPSSDPGVSH
jgi:hypothetical protein